MNEGPGVLLSQNDRGWGEGVGGQLLLLWLSRTQRTLLRSIVNYPKPKQKKLRGVSFSLFFREKEFGLFLSPANF